MILELLNIIQKETEAGKTCIFVCIEMSEFHIKKVLEKNNVCTTS